MYARLNETNRGERGSWRVKWSEAPPLHLTSSLYFTSYLFPFCPLGLEWLRINTMSTSALNGPITYFCNDTAYSKQACQLSHSFFQHSYVWFIHRIEVFFHFIDVKKINLVPFLLDGDRNRISLSFSLNSLKQSIEFVCVSFFDDLVFFYRMVYARVTTNTYKLGKFD